MFICWDWFSSSGSKVGVKTNSSYFQKLISINEKNSINEKEVFYALYKVLPAFLDPNTGGQEIKDITLQNLQSLIPNNASVYITRYGDSPQLSFWYRMAVILSLKDKDIRRDLTQTDYMAIETNIPKTSGTLEEKYDYYVLGPNDKPPYLATLIWSNIFATAWKRH
ncbi:MAG: hypothetical protein M1365_16370 [Actinobacteria bacterium]|nr:hypothetical protein [Actinomycetota bacterium]